HGLGYARVGAPDRALLDAIQCFPRPRRPCGQRRGADADPVAPHWRAGRVEQAANERPRRDARGRLAGTGPLEHTAQIVGDVLERPREVGVAGPWPLEGSPRLRLRRLRLGRHHVFPVLVVAVADHEADRAAEGGAVPDPGEDLHDVALDLHTAAPAVASLAAPQIRV